MNYEDFNEQRIYDSLIIETDIEPKDAKSVTINTVRHLISINIKKIAPPTIRETVNSILLQTAHTTKIKLLEFYFLKIRLQYQRIGISLHEIMRIEKETAPELLVAKINTLITEEQNNVNKLIHNLNIKIQNERVLLLHP